MPYKSYQTYNLPNCQLSTINCQLLKALCMASLPWLMMRRALS